jgi:hypothetical protein
MRIELNFSKCYKLDAVDCFKCLFYKTRRKNTFPISHKHSLVSMDGLVSDVDRRNIISS